jgi:hypothetical protein
LSIHFGRKKRNKTFSNGSLFEIPTFLNLPFTGGWPILFSQKATFEKIISFFGFLSRRMSGIHVACVDTVQMAK